MEQTIAEPIDYHDYSGYSRPNPLDYMKNEEGEQIFVNYQNEHNEYPPDDLLKTLVSKKYYDDLKIYTSNIPPNPLDYIVNERDRKNYIKYITQHKRYPPDLRKYNVTDEYYNDLSKYDNDRSFKNPDQVEVSVNAVQDDAVQDDAVYAVRNAVPKSVNPKFVKPTPVIAAINVKEVPHHIPPENFIGTIPVKAEPYKKKGFLNRLFW
jgi:hypothetical protein